jgi:hypothetical protein
MAVSTAAFVTSPLLALGEGPPPATGPAKLAVAPVALLTTAGSSRDEARPAGSPAALFDSAAFFSSAAFFASAALVAAAPPTGAGLVRTFLFDLQKIDVSSLLTQQTMEQGMAGNAYFTVGIAFTLGPTRAPTSGASLRGRRSSVAPSRMV